MQKGTLTSCVVQYTPVSVIYYNFLDGIFHSYYSVCLIFIMLTVDPLSHNNGRLETSVALCFLPPRRLTFNTGKGSLVPLDQLKLLVSNVGSL